eukprot:2554413-Pleurochrysis_carterae.AAC.1
MSKSAALALATTSCAVRGEAARGHAPIFDAGARSVTVTKIVHAVGIPPAYSATPIYYILGTWGGRGDGGVPPAVGVAPLGGVIGATAIGPCAPSDDHPRELRSLPPPRTRQST